jgi:Fic family protein
MINTPKPDFDSELTGLIVKLEGYRNRTIADSTSSQIFLQLKNLFHIVEALSSARIEGNHTTLADYVDSQTDDMNDDRDSMSEISNIVEAQQFIDSTISAQELSKQYILEIHKLVVRGLKREGDANPGNYRTNNVSITGSNFVPPQHFDVDGLMDELIGYINAKSDRKLDLLKVAVAHHRFVNIHPFGNGNGRTVRLITYAMLCKQGFINADESRLFNPAAVFAADRHKYYEMLAGADTGSDQSVLEWSQYVLEGLDLEISRSSSLADSAFVNEKILLPMLSWAREKNVINDLEIRILQRLVRKTYIKSSDIDDFWPKGVSQVNIAKQLRSMKQRRLIVPTKPNGRVYNICLVKSAFTRGVLQQMEIQGMLPTRLDDLS